MGENPKKKIIAIRKTVETRGPHGVATRTAARDTFRPPIGLRTTTYSRPPYDLRHGRRSSRGLWFNRRLSRGFLPVTT